MRAHVAVVLSLLSLVPVVSYAGDEAVELELAYFIGCTDEKAIEAWIAVKAQELDARDDVATDPKVKARVDELSAKLQALAKSMGTHVPVRMVITEDTARIEYGTRVTLIRMDVDEPYLADFDSKEPTATKVALSALAGDSANQAIKIAFDGMSGKKKQINGQTCLDYKLQGGIKAQVWLAEGDIKGLTAMQEFCIKAKDTMGGFRGEVLWAVVEEAQNFPVLAIGTAHGGLGFDGKTRKQDKPVAMVLCRITHPPTAPETDLEIPADKKVGK